MIKYIVFFLGITISILVVFVQRETQAKQRHEVNQLVREAKYSLKMIEENENQKMFNQSHAFNAKNEVSSGVSLKQSNP